MTQLRSPLIRYPEAQAITARYQDLTALWMDLWLQYHADPAYLVLHPDDEPILVSWFDAPQVRYEITETGEIIEQFPPPVPKKIASLINPITGTQASLVRDEGQTRGHLYLSDASGPPLACLLLTRDAPDPQVPDGSGA